MGASVDFEWVNPVKEVPIRRHIALSILRYTTGNGVRLAFDRWPDPEYVPLYGDAQQVQVAWVHGPDPQVDNFERVTTYETRASVDEIEAYYKDAMLQNGWRLGSSEPPTHFFFSYRYDLQSEEVETAWYARRDLNPRTWLRRPVLYPTELRARV